MVVVITKYLYPKKDLDSIMEIYVNYNKTNIIMLEYMS